MTNEFTYAEKLMDELGYVDVMKARIMKHHSKLLFISDSGHGWIRVPKDMLERMSMKPSDFSSFSFHDERYVYLEEDCDAYKFKKRWDNITVTPLEQIIEDVEQRGRAECRNLPRIGDDI